MKNEKGKGHEMSRSRHPTLIIRLNVTERGKREMSDLLGGGKVGGLCASRSP